MGFVIRVIGKEGMGKRLGRGYLKERKGKTREEIEPDPGNESEW